MIVEIVQPPQYGSIYTLNGSAIDTKNGFIQIAMNKTTEKFSIRYRPPYGMYSSR